MGNSSQVRGKSLDQVLKDWELDHEKVDPYFGFIKIYSNKDSKQQLCLINRISIQDQTINLKAFNFDHPHILKVYYQGIRKQQDFCSSVSSITLVYEYVTNNFQKMIKLRRDNNKGFLESQLCSLIYQSSSALQCMVGQGINHSNLTPTNILLNDQGQVKLFDRSLMNKKVSGLAQVYTGIREDLHLSPEELKLLSQDELDTSSLDLMKCDVFQLGLSCLEAMTLIPTSQLYLNRQEVLKQFYQKFDNEELEVRLKLLNETYSPSLIEIVKSMLNQNPSHRPNFLQIMNLIDSNPDKVDTGVDITQSSTYIDLTLPKIVIKTKNKETISNVNVGHVRNNEQFQFSYSEEGNLNKIFQDPDPNSTLEYSTNTTQKTISTSKRNALNQSSGNLKSPFNSSVRKFNKGDNDTCAKIENYQIATKVSSILQMKSPVEKYSGPIMNSNNLQGPLQWSQNLQHQKPIEGNREEQTTYSRVYQFKKDQQIIPNKLFLDPQTNQQQAMHSNQYGMGKQDGSSFNDPPKFDKISQINNNLFQQDTQINLNNKIDVVLQQSNKTLEKISFTDIKKQQSGQFSFAKNQGFQMNTQYNHNYKDEALQMPNDNFNNYSTFQYSTKDFQNKQPIPIKRTQWFQENANQQPPNDDRISNLILQAQIEIERSKISSQKFTL